MNTVKKIKIENLPQDFSPSTLPEILKLAKKIKGDTAFIYERMDKPFFMETDRLIIRRFTTEDAEAVLALSLDRMNSSMKNFDLQWPVDLEGCKGAAAYFAGEDIYYAVCLKPSITLIGFIAYNSVNDEGILDLGHVWHTAYQDNSLDTEALSLMTQYAFEKLGVNGVTAGNPLDCDEQIAPLKAMGMEIIEIREKASFVNDENGNPIEFTGCKMLITKKKWEENNSESYSPKNKPEILNLVAEINQQPEKLTEKVLHGIPPMGYGDPAAVCYIGSVMRLMEYLKDPVDRNEVFTLSGAALCFPWKAGLCCDEVSILPEIPQRTFAALGYESEYIYEPNIYIEPYSLTETREMINGQPKMTINPRKYTKEFYMEKIKSSINSGRPVIGFGLTELNFTCLITGYRKDGNGLNLRAYWSPQSEPEGYGGQDNYYYTEDWYEKCCGLVIIGEKTGERLKGEQAYRYIQETAKILYEKKTECTQGEIIYNNTAAFDDMIRWLLNDDWWREGFDTGNREMYLAPTGLLLLNYYRAHLRDGLRIIDKQCPGLVNKAVFAFIDSFEEKFQGAAQSRLNLYECVDSSITDISMLRDRTLREKVAAYVENIKKMDQEIFSYIIGTKAE